MTPTVILQVEFDGPDDAAARRARDALRFEAGVMDVSFSRLAEAGPGRSAAGLDFGKLLLTIAPEAVKGVFAAVAAWLRRPGAPKAKGRIRVKLGEDEIRLEGDELTDLSAEALATSAERVIAALAAARASRA